MAGRRDVGADFFLARTVDTCNLSVTVINTSSTVTEKDHMKYIHICNENEGSQLFTLSSIFPKMLSDWEIKVYHLVNTQVKQY